MGPAAALAALAVSAFTSATILPGTSEVGFVAFLTAYPQAWPVAFAVAGLANGLGSVASYGMGRLLPLKQRPSEKIVRGLERWGVWALLLAWLPVAGDGLPIAAGWLRLDFWKSAAMLIFGKFLRYGVLLAGVKGLTG